MIKTQFAFTVFEDDNKNDDEGDSEQQKQQ